MTGEKSMKKLFAICLLLTLFFLPVAYAAADQQVVMEIKGMTCEMCPIAIKKALTDV